MLHGITTWQPCHAGVQDLVLFWAHQLHNTLHLQIKLTLTNMVCSVVVNNFHKQSMSSFLFIRRKKKQLTADKWNEIQKWWQQEQNWITDQKHIFIFPRTFKNSVYARSAAIRCTYNVSVIRLKYIKTNIEMLKCLRVRAVDLQLRRDGQIVSSCSVSPDNEKQTAVLRQVFNILSRLAEFSSFQESTLALHTNIQVDIPHSKHRGEQPGAGQNNVQPSV